MIAWNKRAQAELSCKMWFSFRILKDFFLLLAFTTKWRISGKQIQTDLSKTNVKPLEACVYQQAVECNTKISVELTKQCWEVVQYLSKEVLEDLTLDDL